MEAVEIGCGDPQRAQSKRQLEDSHDDDLWPKGGKKM